MTTRAVGVALLTVLALALVVAPAGASVSGAVPATTAAPDDVCSELAPDSLTVTATTVIDDVPPADGTAFYGGTTLIVVLCDPAGTAVETRGGDGWSLDGTAAISDVNRTERSYVVRLASTNATVSFRDLVERKEPNAGLTVRVTTGAVHDSALPGVGRLAFDSATAVRRYTANESAFRSAAADVEENASALNDTARAITTGRAVNGTDPTLDELAAARDRLSREGNETMLVLHRSAAAGPNTTAALDRVSATRRETRRTADGAVGNYVAALDRLAASHRASIRGTVLSAMIPGLVVGALLGAIVPYRRGNEVADFYQQRSGGTSEYDLRVLRWPLLAAVLVLGVGLALMLFVGGYEGFLP